MLQNPRGLWEKLIELLGNQEQIPLGIVAWSVKPLF